MTTYRRRLAGLTVMGLLVATSLARAADWPEKPITLVVPFSPGGTTDVVARVLAQSVGEQLGQVMVVDNKSGANGNIGSAFVARAAPDGYTALFNTSSIALTPALDKTLGYDVRKDLAPVILTTVVPLGLVINPALPVNTVGEFVDYAKKNPGKLFYGSAGNGNLTHLVAHQIVQHFGIEATHVPYKGSAPAELDVVAGNVQFLTSSINSTMASFIQEGRMRLLAISTAKRVATFPQTPTLAESGMADFGEAGAWHGVMVPAGTPEHVIARLNQAFSHALNDPAVLEKLRAQNAEPLGSSPAQYGAYIDKELARWAVLVKSAGVSIN